ncbi:hypothetical protein ASG88_17585 [Nocardioides sp. Soil777]|nr:hypothetical protein ASG88_17585 [Nocardioides sp. Soil777]
MTELYEKVAHHQTWLISTPYGQSPRFSTAPSGVVHARIDSELSTACGLLAVDWRVFWTRQFDVRDEDACTRCSTVVESRPS